jgi:tRNA threonylcarbamoyl adenosine modification protein (Sua5/YciO/YrdC/YwlC family)
MTRVFEVDPNDPISYRKGTEAAAAAAERGLLVIVPTETVYGIAGRPDRPEATERLFRAKRRPRSLSLPVLAASADQAWLVSAAGEPAKRLAEAFWPGPLTMVLPRTAWSLDWSLGEAAGTVAVRVPDHPVCLALLARTGPLAVTSANLSGEPPLLDRHGLAASFEDAVEVCLLLAAGAPPPPGQPSTVIDLTGDAPSVIRAGPIGLEAVERALQD